MQLKLVLLLIIFNTPCFSQNKIEVFTQLGVSKVELPEHDAKTKQNSQFVPSGLLGISLQKNIVAHFPISISFFINQMEGITKTEKDIYTASVPEILVGVLEGEIEHHITYIGSAIELGYQLNRITIKIGNQFSHAVKSKSKDVRISSVNNHTTKTEENNLDINKFDIGFKMGLLYSLSDRLSIDCMYYLGKKYRYSSYWEWRNHQMLIGLHFALHKAKTSQILNSDE